MVTATRIMKLAIFICPDTSVAGPHESDMETGVHFTSIICVKTDFLEPCFMV